LKTPKIPVYFYALAAMLFWGMSFIWTSILLRSYSPVTIIFMRLIISSGFLFLLIYSFRLSERIRKQDFGLILLSALFNPFFYFLGENYGLKYSTSTITAVIIATIPVFTPVVAWLTFRERLSWLSIGGILVSFCGLIIMLINKDMVLIIQPLGLLFLFGAVGSALVYTVLLKKLTLTYSPLSIVAWQNFIGIFLFLPVFLIFDLKNFTAVRPDTEILSSLLLLAILASSLSFVFFARTIKVLGMSKANIFSNLIPVFTAIFSYVILSEAFSLRKLAGMAVVICGVYISEMNNRVK
jgi:drug/metabolite transporter (DMT)-like permease